jgi:hypothetical protein
VWLLRSIAFDGRGGIGRLESIIVLLSRRMELCAHVQNILVGCGDDLGDGALLAMLAALPRVLPLLIGLRSITIRTSFWHSMVYERFRLHVIPHLCICCEMVTFHVSDNGGLCVAR